MNWPESKNERARFQSERARLNVQNARLFQSGDSTHALLFAHLYLEKVLKAQVVRYVVTQEVWQRVAEEVVP